MTTISIIGAGNMADAIGTRAAKRGHTIELISRDTAKAQAPADQIGNGATVGTFGEAPQGDIVILAVVYQAAVDVVTSRSLLRVRSRSGPAARCCPPRPGSRWHALAPVGGSLEGAALRSSYPRP